MTLYNYKRFLGDSDKIVQKYFNLKEEVKKREIFRKIGLDKYFQPVTSVIRQEIKPFHNLIKKNEEQIIDMDRDRDRDRDGGWGYRQTERDMVDEDDDTDTINLDDEETVDYNIKSDIESLKNGKSTTDDDFDDNEEFFSPLEKKEQQFFPQIEQQPLDNPYDELKKSKFNKKSKEFADEWLKISKEELSYVKGETNFNSFTRNDLVKYRENLKQMQASSSKRTSNKYIQHYDNDVKNQLKLINDKIGKTIKPGKKEIEKEEKYEKDVEENKKIDEMLKKVGKGVKRGNNNGSLIYYNNPQQLIDRLRLLVGSKRAGNTNPEIDSEIIGISDELVRKGLIMNYDYTNFMNKNYIKF